MRWLATARRRQDHHSWTPVDPFTLELYGAMVHPGVPVRPEDQEGAAFAVAVWFIHCFQVMADSGRVR